jgi:hypothetical protein
LSFLSWSERAIDLVGKRRRVVTHEAANKRAIKLIFMLALVAILFFT